MIAAASKALCSSRLIGGALPAGRPSTKDRKWPSISSPRATPE